MSDYIAGSGWTGPDAPAGTYDAAVREIDPVFLSPVHFIS